MYVRSWTYVYLSFLLYFEAFVSFPSDLEGLNFNFHFAVSDSTENIALHSYVLHVSGWPVVPVLPWSRFFLYIIYPVLVVLGSPFTSRFPWLCMGKHLVQALPFVYALQCQTGKRDRNKNKEYQLYFIDLHWGDKILYRGPNVPLQA